MEVIFTINRFRVKYWYDLQHIYTIYKCVVKASLSRACGSSSKVVALVSLHDKSCGLVTPAGVTSSAISRSLCFPVIDSLHSANQCKKHRPIIIAFELLHCNHPFQIESVSFVKNSRKKVTRQKRPGVNIFILERKNLGLSGLLQDLFVWKWNEDVDC